MLEKTQVDVQRLRDLAASVGALMEGHSQSFAELYGFDPNLGDFEAAKWLGELVTDRRDTVLAHAAYLRRTLTDIHEALTHIAGELSDTDAVNGAAIAQVSNPRDQ
jgi:hypothetical protein